MLFPIGHQVRKSLHSRTKSIADKFQLSARDREATRPPMAVLPVQNSLAIFYAVLLRQQEATRPSTFLPGQVGGNSHASPGCKFSVALYGISFLNVSLKLRYFLFDLAPLSCVWGRVVPTILHGHSWGGGVGLLNNEA